MNIGMYIYFKYIYNIYIYKLKIYIYIIYIYIDIDINKNDKQMIFQCHVQPIFPGRSQRTVGPPASCRSSGEKRKAKQAYTKPDIGGFQQDSDGDNHH